MFWLVSRTLVKFYHLCCRPEEGHAGQNLFCALFTNVSPETDAYTVFRFRQSKKQRNMTKPLIRRKSELPQDQYTMSSLSDHKRVDEYLVTPPDVNKC